MLAVALSLAAATCWGVADFAGGLFSRRYPVAAVLFVIEAAGLVGAVLVVAIFADGLPDAATIAQGLAAGMAGVSGLALFYRALAVGEMSVVAPISSTGAVVPVVVGLATGDTLTTVIATGLAIVFVGVLLAAREAEQEIERGEGGRGLLPALGAAVGFGTFFVLFKGAADGSTEWAILLSRIPAIPLVGGVLLTQKIALPRGTDLKRLIAVGQADVLAVMLYSLAITRGALSIVAVVGSLYPVVTVLLARVVLGERMARVQVIGVAAALTGVALVSAGSA